MPPMCIGIARLSPHRNIASVTGINRMAALPTQNAASLGHSMTGAGSESSRAPLRVAPDQVRGDGGLTIDAAHLTRYSAWMSQLYFSYPSMNPGKSPPLLQADFNYHERGLEAMLRTAALDHRYGRRTLEGPSDVV